jgi:hypothetical protein
LLVVEPEPAEPAEPLGLDGAFFCAVLPEVLPEPIEPLEPLELLPADEPLEPLVAPLPALLPSRSHAERVAASASAKARERVRFMRGAPFESPA